MEDAAIQALLEEVADEARPLAAEGKVADYIPALAKVPKEKFGLAVHFVDGREFAVGDAAEPFSIQSVSKLFNLAIALDWIGDEIWTRVGREPSGTSFNSLILLEQEQGIPRNPLINPGAIVVIDALLERYPLYSQQLRNMMRRLSGDAGVRYDQEVWSSEEAHGDLNRAMAWLMKAKGNLHCPPDETLAVYFRACSLAMSCRALARAGRFLLGGTGDWPICNDPARRRRILAVLRLCGLYDAAGDFAYRVGLPAKSGVGGGLLAFVPGLCTICVWSPALDAKGNSVAGVRALELLVNSQITA
ncbi:MAG: glutaminase [Rhodospirillales bacterium]